MTNNEPWAVSGRKKYPVLGKDIEVDVLVIGGGISGVTAAYLLAKAGKKVVLVERSRLYSAETGHTTAHISYPTDIRLTDLVEKFGANHAQAAWDAGAAAASQIAAIVKEENIDCDLRQVPGYLFAARGKEGEGESASLHKEAHLAAELGFDADFVEDAEVVHRPAIVFANLMKFHPGKYVEELAKRVAKQGGQIFEQSSAEEFKEKPLSVSCNGHTIRYQDVFFATHVPLQGNTSTAIAAIFQTKLAGYSTYALRAKVSGDVPEALFWDTSDPYLYIRIDKGTDGNHVVIGGEDHKTGQVEETERCFQHLVATLQEYFPGAETIDRWSGQVIETVDGLPYIGKTAEHQYVATGFSGTGMTFGTLGAMMFRDAVMGIQNPWKELFAADRKELSSTWDYLVENKDYPYYYLKTKLAGVEGHSVADVCGEEAKILRLDGRKVAAYRDDKGKLSLCSAVCPHMGCIVAWNKAEKTWDCPCHGSRFGPDGSLIAGPAETPLSKVNE